MINRENYEIWFIDFIDGKLNQEAIEKLNAFLVLHPDLQEEFQLLTTLPSTFQTHPDSVFEHKHSLKKTESVISDEDNLLLAKEIEGDLNANEAQRLIDHVSDNENLRKHREAMSRTRLSKTFLPFEYKGDLLFNDDFVGREDDFLILQVLEGNANSTEQAECTSKLHNDSNFKARYESYAKIKLIAPEHWCDFRDRLHFSDRPDFTQKEVLLAAWAEGDLSGKNKVKAEELIKSDAFVATVATTLQQAKLVAPQNIVFNHKDALYRKQAVIIPLKKYLAYASGIAAIFVFMFWILSRDQETPVQFATENDGKKQINQPEKVSNPKTPENNTASMPAEQNHDDVVRKNSPGITPQDPRQEVAQQVEQRSEEQENPRVIQEHISIQNNEMAHHNENNFNQDTNNNKEIHPNSNQVSNPNTEPNMGLVYQETHSSNKVFHQEGASLLSMVGKAAGERLGKTHAYALAERQISKWSASTEENIERDFSNDHMHLKLGNISIDRKKEDKPEKKVRGGIIGLIQRTYRKMENTKK